MIDYGYMDLTQSRSNFSLRFLSQSHTAPIADDSIAFQIDSSVCEASSNTVRPVPLQLMEPQTEISKEGREQGGGDEREVEEFRILGHSMCLKRRRDNTDSSSPSPSTKLQGLESRRSAVRAWGNQALSVADPDVFGIMEKEKQRQYRGIENGVL